MVLKIKVQKNKEKPIILGALIVIITGCLYIISLSLTPYALLQLEKAKTNLLGPSPLPAPRNENTIYIPKIHVVSQFQTGDTSALNNGAWHRFPERGNPEKGGNFILSAHRFELAPTPAEVHRKSPFFAIDEIQPGDEIVIDYNKQRYNYKVEKRYKVKPSELSIELPSTQAKLTLYTCTLGGEFDGREVIEATPVMPLHS